MFYSKELRDSYTYVVLSHDNIKYTAVVREVFVEILILHKMKIVLG
jgi:hypothetical protein